jgi:aspartate racemase
LGPQATIEFEALIHKAAQDIIPQKENRGYPPVVSIYVRSAPMDLSKMPKEFIPDKRFLDAVRKIGKISDFLVIPSNTPHFFKEDIESASGKKILSIVDVTLEEIKKERIIK